MLAFRGVGVVQLDVKVFIGLPSMVIDDLDCNLLLSLALLEREYLVDRDEVFACGSGIFARAHAN